MPAMCPSVTQQRSSESAGSFRGASVLGASQAQGGAGPSHEGFLLLPVVGERGLASSSSPTLGSHCAMPLSVLLRFASPVRDARSSLRPHSAWHLNSMLWKGH